MASAVAAPGPAFARLLLVLSFAAFPGRLLFAQPAGAPVDWQTQPLGGATLFYTAADSGLVPWLGAALAAGRDTVEAFFGRPYARPFAVRVLPDRAALDAYWRQTWNVPDLQTECWMVGSGGAAELTLLSPRAWADEACEHDPADTLATRRFLTHELVHVYHGQSSPRPDFEGMDAIGWLPEGLAIHVSGQLDGSYLASPREAVETGRAPAELEQAWSGKYRYGVSGSLVRYVDVTYGRAVLLDLLDETTEEGVLGVLGTTEADLLAAWRRWVTAQGE